MSITSHSHYILYKPYGYVSQFVSTQRKSHRKKYLGELYSFHPNTMSVGRLDEKSEGLLFLTTDGKLSNSINTQGVEKEYYALVDGIVSAEAIAQLQHGVTISIQGRSYTTKSCAVRSISTPTLPKTKQRIRDDRHGPTSWISITLTEGKFRQVRKMTASVGFPTLRLVRFRIGSRTIEGMDCATCFETESLL